MLRLAHAAPARHHTLRGTHALPFATLCEQLGEVLGLSLVQAPAGELNVVDRMLQDRLAPFAPLFAAGTSPAPAPDAPSDLRDGLAALCAVRSGANGRAVRQVQLASKTLELLSGTLTYHDGGSGPVLVILNALGQSMHYWSRLLAL
jgi:hypothetical protein